MSSKASLDATLLTVMIDSLAKNTGALFLPGLSHH